MKKEKKDLLLNLLSVLSIVVFICLWMIVSSKEDSLIPTPIAVWQRYLRVCEKPISKVPLIGHIWASMKRVLGGLLIASVSGIAFGLLIGWSKTCRRILKPIFEMIRPVPALAWIPLFTIWLGIGEQSKVGLVTLGCFMPIVVNTFSGVRFTPQITIDAAKIYGANKLQMISEVIMPASLSAIIAGIKTALGSGWIVVLAAEMISADRGLGFLIIRGSDINDMSLVILAMLLIGIIGALMSAFLSFLERKLCPWKSEIN